MQSAKTPIKNDLILKALWSEPCSRPPVWMMRQAGRYLPEYMAIRSQMSFLELCKNPKKAAEVSVQPYEILGVDAIIMFSDILVPLEPMGAGLDFDTGKPRFVNPTRTPEQISALKNLSMSEIENFCSYVYETISEIKNLVKNEVPVLGFAGAPWTLASYMIEGGGSKEFAEIKKLMYQNPRAMHELLDKLSDVIAQYLMLKLKHGADALQLFDTWASVLTQKDYQEFALPYQQKIIAKIKQAYPHASITLYVNGVANVLDYMIASGANCLSIDWRANLQEVKEYIDSGTANGNAPLVAVQGNFDPCALLGPESRVIDLTLEMLEGMRGKNGYIANLGHGIIPQVPVKNAKAFIDTVKSWS
jgi:uroporphyrinogen decarboxylase